MTQKTRVLLWISLLCLILTGGPALAAMQALNINWFTVDGGGGQSSGGEYSLHGTIGQPDVGAMSGGEYTLAGGIWSGAISKLSEQKLFLPMVIH